MNIIAPRDLESLLTLVYCLADDARPTPLQQRKPRSLTDAEIVSLGVAQAVLGFPSERRFLRAGKAILGNLFPHWPEQSRYNRRLRDAAGLLHEVLQRIARLSGAADDNILLVDATLVKAGRQWVTTRRSALRDVAGTTRNLQDKGYFWGFRLHLLTTQDGFPIAYALTGASHPERPVLLDLVDGLRMAGRAIFADKGYTGAWVREEIERYGGRIFTPIKAGRHTASKNPYAYVRQPIESAIQTLKRELSLELAGGRTVEGVRARYLQRLLALGAVIWLNKENGAPPRSTVAYDH